MAARYERVRATDGDGDEPASRRDDARANTINTMLHTIPNSPPPSFHSRASSRSSRLRGRPVDPALADAFGSDDDDDEHEHGGRHANNDDDGASSDEDNSDDRQRLMRSRDALRPMRAPPSGARAGAGAGAGAGQASSSPSTSPAPRTTTTTSTTTTTAATTPRSGRVYGGGIQSDGVFSNLTARPEPGEEKEELPPTYEQAAADAAPPYWETTILGPGLGGPDEVYVDGMPVGSVFSFVWNGMISMSFQVVGFLLTYLLHSTHAAKNGSRAGLGITLIQYGFYMKGVVDDNGGSGSGGGSGGGNNGGAGAMAAAASSDDYTQPPDPNAHDFDPGAVAAGGGGGGGGGGSLSDLASSDWLAYVLMIVGWFVLIRAVSDYYKARRHEQLVLQSPDRGLGVAVVAAGESPERAV